jgi:hypothetical protein
MNKDNYKYMDNIKIRLSNIFNKVLNEAIYSQSFSTYDNFIKNFSSFIEKIKSEINDNENHNDNYNDNYIFNHTENKNKENTENKYQEKENQNQYKYQYQNQNQNENEQIKEHENKIKNKNENKYKLFTLFKKIPYFISDFLTNQQKININLSKIKDEDNDKYKDKDKDKEKEKEEGEKEEEEIDINEKNEEIDNKIKSKEFLDYFIFIFSEKTQNKNSVFYLIKFELNSLFTEKTKCQIKNIQILLNLIFYVLIFFTKEKNKLKDIKNILIFIKEKLNKEEKENQKENPINKNQPKNFYFSSKIKLEIYLNFIDKYLYTNFDDFIYIDELKKIKKDIFNDCINRENFFSLILDFEIKSALDILIENELILEAILLLKLIDPFSFSFSFSFKSLFPLNLNLNLNNEVKDYENFYFNNYNNLNFEDFYIDKIFYFLKLIEKFIGFLYIKQIYQAQKCQNVVKIYKEFFNFN